MASRQFRSSARPQTIVQPAPNSVDQALTNRYRELHAAGTGQPAPRSPRLQAQIDATSTPAKATIDPNAPATVAPNYLAPKPAEGK
jgi:hypothetical protein